MKGLSRVIHVVKWSKTQSYYIWIRTQSRKLFIWFPTPTLKKQAGMGSSGYISYLYRVDNVVLTFPWEHLSFNFFFFLFLFFSPTTSHSSDVYFLVPRHLFTWINPEESRNSISCRVWRLLSRIAPFCMQKKNTGNNMDVTSFSHKDQQIWSHTPSCIDPWKKLYL